VGTVRCVCRLSEAVPALRRAAKTADVVIVSYHGGEEFAAAPTPRTREFAAAVMRQGVMLFLGHHPHVPYGIEKAGKGYIVHSLGNFVFLQPQNDWAQRSYGVEMIIDKRDSTAVCAVGGDPSDQRCVSAAVHDGQYIADIAGKEIDCAIQYSITLTKKEKSH